MATSASFDDALALSRFGLGSGPEGCDAIGGRARQILADEIRAGSAIFNTDPPLKSSAELLSAVADYRTLVRAHARDASVALPTSPVAPVYLNELTLRYNGPLMAPQIGFNERLVMFWTNHFAVSIDKSEELRSAAGAFEREAIRPNIFGRFKDLVMAVETHPAMLLYLDNPQSVGPDSTTGVKSKRGLNENLAREIMELHILGVGSGYTQGDVTAFAKALTGWTLAGGNWKAPNGREVIRNDFYFAEAHHEPGDQDILGRVYSDDGFFQAADVLHDLAGRPEAAHFIAGKLARHFVSDTPPSSLIKRLADVFLQTDGDLALVSHALIEAPEAWTPECVKMRLPQEYLAAMLRASGAHLPTDQLNMLLAAMGQPLWRPAGPNGYSDRFDAWATPSGLLTRMDAADRVASLTTENIDPRFFAASRLGSRLNARTLEAVSRAESPRQALSLVFMSPEFMRR